MAAEYNAKKVKKTATSENKLIAFFKEMKAEVKRITWAPKHELKKATTTVITFCLMYAVFVGLLDYCFNNIYRVIFK